MTNSQHNDALNACAGIVERGDPDRFLAAMAAPISARARLFPLYALNVEISRAPWVTGEAMIAEMRLQWWHDALGEIAASRPVPNHEVLTPLTQLLSPQMATDICGLIEARQWDIYFDPFTDMAEFDEYINATSGTLMAISSALLGQGDTTVPRQIGIAHGVANWLRAVPALRAAGRAPLVDDTPKSIENLARSTLDLLKSAHAARGDIAKSARPALRAAWQTRAVLTHAARTPDHVRDGVLVQSPFAQKTGLMWRVATNRW